VQHRFLRFIGIKCFNQNPNDTTNYEEIEQKLNLDSLETRRTVADLKFITKSFNKQIDGQTFMSHLQFFEPKRSARNAPVFNIKFSRTDIGKFSVCNRLMSTFNKFFKDKTFLSRQPTTNKIKEAIISQQT
jgi:hypothetical protein